MINRILILIFCIYSSSISYGQSARIYLSNPSPRVGDIIDISFYSTSDSFKKNLETGNLQFNKVISSAGKHSIGPFSFNINNKDYTSNIITLKVDPKLPDAVEGLWLRQVKFENEEYLIIEQKIELKANSNKINFSKTFADLKEKIFLGDDKISFANWSEGLNDDDKSNVKVSSQKRLVYHIRVYKILKGKDFDGQFVLTKKSFTNFPSRIDFLDFVIH